MIKGKFPEIPRFYRTKRDPPAIHRKEAGFGQRYDDDVKKDDHLTDDDVKKDEHLTDENAKKDDHLTDENAKKDDHLTDENAKKDESEQKKEQKNENEQNQQNDEKDLNHQLVKILDSFQKLDLKQLRLLLVNLHSQINSYRPIQAKQLLLMHMHQQIQHKKELIATLKLRIEQASIYLKKT